MVFAATAYSHGSTNSASGMVPRLRQAESTRDLIAGLNQVVARASLLRRKITPELVAEALATVEVAGAAWSLEQIRDRVARSYGVTAEQLRGRSRQRRFVRPRQLAMYLCRRYTDASLKQIGRAFGRDHSSVIYAIDVVERRIVEQPQLRYQLEALTSRFSPGAPRIPTASRSALGSTRGTRPT